tara:strand:+ start:284 stop:391 length:108 start_codon:yes stop_codon:yes gene_type:complete
MVLPGIHVLSMNQLEANSSNFDFIICDEVDNSEEY